MPFKFGHEGATRPSYIEFPRPKTSRIRRELLERPLLAMYMYRHAVNSNERRNNGSLKVALV